MKFKATHFKTILLIGAAIFILLLLRDCRGKEGAAAKLKAESAALQHKYEQDSINFATQVARWQDSIHNAGINSDLQVKVIKEVEKKYQASRSTINRLTAIIRSSPELPDRSKGVLVSSDFKQACDSLPSEIDKLNAALAEKDTAINGLIALMDYEVVYRDSLIKTGKEYIDSLRRDYNSQKLLFNAAIKAAEPRGKLLGGIGLIGNETNPLSGTKINLAYQSRNGKQYMVGGLLMKGGVYYEATILITLIK